MTPTARPAGRAARSLHQRIVSDIGDRILSSEWAPGFRIPYEYELSQLYGCSRMTVNKALSQLAKAGLIERRRRSGSFVRSPRSQSAILEIHDIRTEVAALGLPYRFQITDKLSRKADTSDRARLGLAKAEPVLQIACLHFAGERPFCHEDRLINLAVVPAAKDENFDEIAPGPWLLDRVPWSAAEHRIRAAGASAELAAALDIDPKTPVLVVERQTWSADHSVTHVRFTYPGQNQTLVARFTPSQG